MQHVGLATWYRVWSSGLRFFNEDLNTPPRQGEEDIGAGEEIDGDEELLP